MSSADGYLKIKTKIDNNDVDKDIKSLENKISSLESRNVTSRKEEKILQQQVDKYNELIDKAEQYKNKIAQLQTIQGGKISDSTLSEIAKAQMALTETNLQISKQEKGMDNIYIKLDKIKQKQIENNMKIGEYKDKIEKIKSDKVKNSIDSVGKSLQGQIGKISKMAMAVVGIRTAWMGVRRIVSMVQQYNPQISADLNYMGYAISQIFLPVVQKLTSVLYTVLSYVNAMMSAWFGINLFSNASVKNFKKMSGTAKEIKNSLAGFDEMNVLQDNSSNSSNATPSMDLSQGIQGEIPEWLQWIIDNKDLILTILRRYRNCNTCNKTWARWNTSTWDRNDGFRDY